MWTQQASVATATDAIATAMRSARPRQSFQRERFLRDRETILARYAALSEGPICSDCGDYHSVRRRPIDTRTARRGRRT